MPMLLWGVNLPKEPIVPTVVNQKNSNKNKQSNNKNKLQYKIKVTLSDGRTIIGKIRLSMMISSFKVRHDIGGFKYFKTVSFANMKTVTIKSWKAILRSAKKRMYYFVPSVYDIQTYDGAKLPLKKRLKVFDMFYLQNKYGMTTLYSYFIDYWNDTSKGKYWSNSGKGFKFNLTNPPKGVVTKIEFLRAN